MSEAAVGVTPGLSDFLPSWEISTSSLWGSPAGGHHPGAGIIPVYFSSLITQQEGWVAAERGHGVCTAPSSQPCSHLCQLCFTSCLRSVFGGQDQGSGQLGVGTKAPDAFKGHSSDPMKVLFTHISLLNEPWLKDEVGSRFQPWVGSDRFTLATLLGGAGRSRTGTELGPNPASIPRATLR